MGIKMTKQTVLGDVEHVELGTMHPARPSTTSPGIINDKMVQLFTLRQIKWALDSITTITLFLVQLLTIHARYNAWYSEHKIVIGFLRAHTKSIK